MKPAAGSQSYQHADERKQKDKTVKFHEAIRGGEEWLTHKD